MELKREVKSFIAQAPVAIVTYPSSLPMKG
jgi:hypothetical protein